MGQSVRITVLAQNTVGGCGLLGEHGLAFWIESGPERVLFDTGQGLVLEHNARTLEIPLGSADAIILSHGHKDHAGGLDRTLKVAPKAKLFAHPYAFRNKYMRSDDGTARFVGIPSLPRNNSRGKTGGSVWTTGPTKICDGVFVTGEIPRKTAFEDTGGPFFLDERCLQSDPLIDDQAIFFQAAAGTVVLLGCAHAGVINTIQYIRELTDNGPIHAVIGGMHLGDASPERIDRTIEAIRKLEIECLVPVHCTGMRATVKFWTIFPDQSRSCNVGKNMEFQK